MFHGCPRTKPSYRRVTMNFCQCLMASKTFRKVRKVGEKLVLLCGVDNESSSRLQQEQLRLNIYRQTRAAAGSILETSLNARKSTQKGLRR